MRDLMDNCFVQSPSKLLFSPPFIWECQVMKLQNDEKSGHGRIVPNTQVSLHSSKVKFPEKNLQDNATNPPLQAHSHLSSDKRSSSAALKSTSSSNSSPSQNITRGPLTPCLVSPGPFASDAVTPGEPQPRRPCHRRQM